MQSQRRELADDTRHTRGLLLLRRELSLLVCFRVGKFADNKINRKLIPLKIVILRKKTEFKSHLLPSLSS